jgi:hypothetical protein
MHGRSGLSRKSIEHGARDLSQEIMGRYAGERLDYPYTHIVPPTPDSAHPPTSFERSHQSISGRGRERHIPSDDSECRVASIGEHSLEKRKRFSQRGRAISAMRVHIPTV